MGQPSRLLTFAGSCQLVAGGSYSVGQTSGHHWFAGEFIVKCAQGAHAAELAAGGDHERAVGQDV